MMHLLGRFLKGAGSGRGVGATPLLALLPMASPACAQGPVLPGALSGRVVDPDGRPVAGARIATTPYDRATRADRVEFEARTDAAGRFRIGPARPYFAHRADFTVEAAGFAVGTIPGAATTIYPGVDHDLGDVALDRGRVFSGFVVDEEGGPRPGAEVVVSVSRHVMGHTVNRVGPELTLRTDEAGRYRTPPLPVGRVIVAARMVDYQTTHATASSRPGGEEELPPIVLARDVPVPGVVRDEQGRPIAGAEIGGTVGHTATSDADGRFALRGFGPNPSFQLNVSRFGYEGKVGLVAHDETGYRYTAEDRQVGPELAVTLRRLGTIEGRAVDAATGQPVTPATVLLYRVLRPADGEIKQSPVVGRGEGLAEGNFHLTYPEPAEYRLVLGAPGYRDAEVALPPIERLGLIAGVVARMEQGLPGPPPSLARQKIIGVATRDDVPVPVGWVAIQRRRRPSDAINAPVRHGRLIEGEAVSGLAVPIRDGTFELPSSAPLDQVFVLVAEPGRPATQVGPITLREGEGKRIDVACGPAGRIRGTVSGVPFEWEGHGWVVAFSRTGIVRDARIRHGGDFSLDDLPPGEYGLKAGHDAYEDPETFPGDLMRQFPDAAGRDADPWKAARVIRVGPGEVVEGVPVAWPE